MMQRLLCFLFIPLAFLSCMDDNRWNELNGSGATNNHNAGVFIINEGNFGYDNASLSYYDIDSMKILNQAFYRTNHIPLGDVAQSMTIKDSLAYIVINNSGKIYIINTHTFAYYDKITGLCSPRYILFITDEKAYVTDLYGQAITIVNPKTRQITGYIDVSNPESSFNQHTTDMMVTYENYIFTNCWSFDHKILVIDTEHDVVIDSIETLIQPNSMVLDKYDQLWVLSDGGYAGNPFGYEKPGLMQIDAASLSIKKTFRFNLEDSPSSLCINGTKDTLYFINKDIYRHPVLSQNIPEIIIESPYTENNFGGFYGLDIDPYNSEIYIADARDNNSQGKVYRYSATGHLIDEFYVGIIPGAFCFKKAGND